VHSPTLELQDHEGEGAPDSLIAGAGAGAGAGTDWVLQVPRAGLFPRGPAGRGGRAPRCNSNLPRTCRDGVTRARGLANLCLVLGVTELAIAPWGGPPRHPGQRSGRGVTTARRPTRGARGRAAHLSGPRRKGGCREERWPFVPVAPPRGFGPHSPWASVVTSARGLASVVRRNNADARSNPSVAHRSVHRLLISAMHLRRWARGLQRGERLDDPDSCAPRRAARPRCPQARGAPYAPRGSAPRAPSART
jgi:hypothetical protein